jgi:hypothetical protein
MAAVLSQGIDVSPTAAPTYIANGYDKAAEYGSILMLFPWHVLRKTSCWIDEEKAESVSPETVAEYPHRIAAPGGCWLTRRNPEHFHAGYDVSYGYYVPGDPFQALTAVIVLGPSLEVRVQEVRSAIAEWAPSIWSGGEDEAKRFINALDGQ